MTRRILALFACLFLTSCNHNGPDDDSTADDDSNGDDDTETTYGPDGCLETALGASPFTELTSEIVPEIPLVVTARWTTDQAATCSVRFGASTDDYTTEFSVAPVEDNQYYGILKGLHANTDVHFRVFAEIEGELFCTEDQVMTTGALSPYLPSLSLSVANEELAAGGYTVIPVVMADGMIMTILDQDAQYVWFWEHDVHPSLRAIMASDHGSVLVSQDTFLPESKIRKIRMDGKITDIDTPYMGFDFVEIEPGHYAYVGGEVRTLDGDRDFYGDTIVEVWEDGTTETVWHLMDHFLPDLDLTYPEFMNQYADTEFFTHVNSLSYDPTTDSFLVVHAKADDNHLADMIVNVDRSTGDLLWTLSDSTGDFTHQEELPLVGWPHSCRYDSDGTLLVFNRFTPGGEDCSEVTQIALDQTNWTAERIWSYVADPCLHATFLGHGERIWNDNIVAIYAASGQIDEATPDGELVWRINLDLGAGFGQGDRVESLY